MTDQKNLNAGGVAGIVLGYVDDGIQSVLQD